MYRNLLCSVGHVKTGVLQGPVLGPLFPKILLYVNDEAEKMISVCTLYGDDNCVQQC